MIFQICIVYQHIKNKLESRHLYEAASVNCGDSRRRTILELLLLLIFLLTPQYLFYDFILKHYEILTIVGFEECCFLLDPLLKKLRSVLVSAVILQIFKGTACEFANSLSESLPNKRFL